jgi:hypothetical protein
MQSVLALVQPRSLCGVLHCCCTVVTLVLLFFDCGYTGVTLLLHYCHPLGYTVGNNVVRVISTCTRPAQVPVWCVTLLLHYCHTIVTLVLHCCYTVVPLVSHCCYTVVTLLLHCCALFLHCCYTVGNNVGKNVVRVMSTCTRPAHVPV